MKSIKDLLNFSIININKPSGPTSFTVSQYVKRALNLNKTSHLGTLDPIVTGVLPVALGRACKLNDYFMHRDKEYVGIMRLHEGVSEEKLKSEMAKFIGKIEQLPPVRSRVKRAVREREVKKFELLEKSGKHVLFVADVQAGTYIRKLVHDLGEKIGGAHMLELRRTKAGIFDESEIYNLYDFDKAVEELKLGNEEPIRSMLYPADMALKEVLPTVKLKDKNLNQLLTGKPLMKDDILTDLPEEKIFAAFHKDKFIAVYHKVEEKDIIARPEFVFN